MDAAFDAQLLAEVGAETHAELHADASSDDIVPAIVISHPARKDRALGVVLAGGKWTGPKGPDMTQSAADGSELAPYDPFSIEKWHSKLLARRQAYKQHKVNLVSQLEALKATAERTKRRLAQEAKEIAEEKARVAAEEEAAKLKNKQEVESELMEISADATTETEAETETAVESESEMLAELAAEAAVDAEQESAQELEAQADAEEEAEDLASAEADIEAGFEVDVEAEFGTDADAETDAESEAESETDADSESEDDDALLAELSASDPVGTDRPSDYVTMGREDLIDESFNNNGGRAVFARRQREKEIVRFEKTTQSSGGNAVVNGVTKLPCGKEITDKGLFAAAVSENLGATVEAANPEEPIAVDENIAVIKALPVVPQNAPQQTVDEYGDAQEE